MIIISSLKLGSIYLVAASCQLTAGVQPQIRPSLITEHLHGSRDVPYLIVTGHSPFQHGPCHDHFSWPLIPNPLPLPESTVT